MMSDVSPDNVSHAEAGRWLTIQEAAHHLSVSERTVYRRADRGQLQRRTHPDGRVEVWVPGDEVTLVSDVSPDTVSQERAVILVDRVSAAVSRQLESLTAELAASRERIEALARENGTLSERVVGLERELTGVRHVSDGDRQRLTVELVAARATIASLAALTLSVSDPSERPAADQPAPEGPDPDISTQSPWPAPIPPTPNTAPWWHHWRVSVPWLLLVAILVLAVAAG